MRPSLLFAVAMALALSAPALAERPQGIRAIAVGPKLDLKAAESLEGFRQEIERLMSRAHREFSTEGPNLVVFGGDWALLTALLGPEHRAARSAKTLAEAQEALRQAHFWDLAWTRATHWGLSEEAALSLILADALYRPFATTFSEAARRHHAYVVAGASLPDVAGMKPFQSMRTFADRPVRPLGTGRYRKAFLFDPDGRLVGEVKQVRREAMDLASGRLEDIHPFDLPFGKVGIALGADARDPSYLARLDDAGCQILLLPALQAGPWAESGTSGDWHPGEWLDATVGILQASRSAHVRYTVAAMATGLYYEQVFDGQSAIMARCDRACGRLFVGVEPPGDEPLTGEVLALAPWVVEDPKFVHASAGPATSLRDRREYLRKVARTLQRGGNRENQFLESLATADLAVR